MSDSGFCRADFTLQNLMFSFLFNLEMAEKNAKQDYTLY
jgi:hypothetical protein